ncbi:hypothetical protein GCM10010103_01480 [Streptomyces paradoxus]|uniref:Uncharacterized protein n=1 Tax=Streptomyces paradoxus TaxID=66375 RepID=A0A7W9WG52_9ACTN|nr:hypothetical protein [Streptomyces paradoxus]MBB6074975.1 hypothetical protein [Streptomyces paradoxus]
MLSLVERDEAGMRQAVVVEVPVDGPVTLGATVEGAQARFWYVRDGVRTAVGPALDFGHVRRPRLPAAVQGGDGGDRCPGPRGRGVHSGLHRVSADLHTLLSELFGVSKVLAGVKR